MTTKTRIAGYSIGEVARVTGLSAKTIRYYEQIGLIPKASRRSFAVRTGGDRVYSGADVGRLRFIRQARQMDLGLADVRELLSISDAGCPSTQPAYVELLRRHVRSIDQRINHLLGQRSAVHQLLGRGKSADGACCTWESCGCMRASPSPKQREMGAAERKVHV